MFAGPVLADRQKLTITVCMLQDLDILEQDVEHERVVPCCPASALLPSSLPIPACSWRRGYTDTDPGEVRDEALAKMNSCLQAFACSMQTVKRLRSEADVGENRCKATPGKVRVVAP